MNVLEKKPEAAPPVEQPIPVNHFVRGKLVSGNAITHRSRDLGVDFVTPEIDLNALVAPRSELPPLLDVPTSEIIDFLVEAGQRMDFETNPYLQEALEHTVKVNPLPRRVVENLFRRAKHFLTPEGLRCSIESSFLNPAALDGWVERTDMHGNKGALRAFPPRMVHMLAGNSPTGCISSIAQGALVKAINVFKMPSSDPFTCVAMLRTMADVDPDHPVVRSMSAVYWRGGDERIEGTLYRPQYFDKIVAWGGGDAIRNVIKYIGPGIQMVSFDPKTSISMIGPEGFENSEVIDEIADAAATDVATMNQEACLASRFIFVEGEREGVEVFCARLQERLGVDRETTSALAHPLPVEVRDEIEMLQLMDDECTVWGKPDGRGLVILTSEPVDFHPSNKTANVVHVSSLDDAIRYVNVATQTIGMYPPERKRAMRDRLASAGAQRVVRLGGAAKHVMGGAHDGMLPLQRFVHWMSDEDA
ncbi:acyl-CoA reductase [Sphingomonas sp. LaA6.9]|uniref:acyl-CoA reductase n=1 Tax=Sphingomonas sp. LaA6.9 TaxID=2919914 RepID=UPI001F4FB71A|nr:acyl-CoA reductase [Sphingomonas sp. LaA6.9]MCJ8156047.1 long-chain-fatty-acyl-CoA reductase [Sphingomonas sp. LaA6.9]